MVAEDQQPPGPEAARGRELRPSAPQERAVSVPPDLDAPHLDLAAGRVGDAGLPGADFLGELVGNALRVQKDESFLRPGRSIAGWKRRPVLPDCRRRMEAEPEVLGVGGDMVAGR